MSGKVRLRQYRRSTPIYETLIQNNFQIAYLVSLQLSDCGFERNTYSCTGHTITHWRIIVYNQSDEHKVFVYQATWCSAVRKPTHMQNLSNGIKKNSMWCSPAVARYINEFDIIKSLTKCSFSITETKWFDYGTCYTHLNDCRPLFFSTITIHESLHRTMPSKYTHAHKSNTATANNRGVAPRQFSTKSTLPNTVWHH